MGCNLEGGGQKGERREEKEAFKTQRLRGKRKWEKETLVHFIFFLPLSRHGREGGRGGRGASSIFPEVEELKYENTSHRKDDMVFGKEVVLFLILLRAEDKQERKKELSTRKI